LDSVWPAAGSSIKDKKDPLSFSITSAFCAFAAWYHFPHQRVVAIYTFLIPVMRTESSSQWFWLAAWLWLPLIAARETIPFDYGWKHRTGLTDWAMPNDLPPTDTDPGVNPKEASLDYDDSGWWDVQLPHDGLIVNAPSKEACPDGCSGRSYIPRHVLWYRNTFSLPEEWLEDHQSSKETGTGSLLSLEFEGSFRNTTVWLNGKLVLNHVSGYTPFRIELEPDLLRSGDTQTVAVFVDPDNGDNGGTSRGSGWWYESNLIRIFLFCNLLCGVLGNCEGGGLYRHVRLVKTNAVHVEPNGLFVKSEFPSGFSKGRTSTVALRMKASIVSNESSGICYAFEVKDPNGLRIASTKSSWLSPFPVKENKWTSFTVEEHVELHNPMMWTSAEPNLYQVDVVLAECDENAKELDRVSVRHGIRKIYFDANHGFFLNDEKYKIRGFCDHDTFAVVGMALPDRINLFRVRSFVSTTRGIHQALVCFESLSL
jgi:beta-galactosidase